MKLKIYRETLTNMLVLLRTHRQLGTLKSIDTSLNKNRMFTSVFLQENVLYWINYLGFNGDI